MQIQNTSSIQQTLLSYLPDEEELLSVEITPKPYCFLCKSSKTVQFTKHKIIQKKSLRYFSFGKHGTALCSNCVAKIRNRQGRTSKSSYCKKTCRFEQDKIKLSQIRCTDMPDLFKPNTHLTYGDILQGRRKCLECGIIVEAEQVKENKFRCFCCNHKLSNGKPKLRKAEDEPVRY